jgi:hypothetical protein
VCRRKAGGGDFCALELSGAGYPYVLLAPGKAAYHDDDELTLESEDGGYSETVTFAEGVPGPASSVILWFPEPPADARARLRLQRANGEPAYYLSVDRPLPSLGDGGEARR